MDKIPINPIEAKRIRRQTSFYTVQNGELFRSGFVVLLLKCLNPEQAQYVLVEMHRGICEICSGARSMAARVVLLAHEVKGCP